ncbi:SHOCT domain-containing protein [Streptomyces sp. NPDC096080]|uniref:SHOCT domain-containing protein n=1 Tax=Streptomyces sp. NPDC096080 TaxID=3156693 RepID=UPI00332BA487
MNASTYLAYDYPLLGAFWTILFITLATMWFILLFRVVADIFRDHTTGGPEKTLWLLCVLCLPFFGVFVYVLARGGAMGEREARRNAALHRETAASAAREGGPATSGDLDELARLADLKAHGDISEAEYAHAKEKILH